MNQRKSCRRQSDIVMNKQTETLYSIILALIFVLTVSWFFKACL